MRRALPWLVLAAAVVFAGWKLHTSHFDWKGFTRSLRSANLWLIALAILLLYANNLFRALRWAVFLRPTWRTFKKHSVRKPLPWYGLLGSQFIGFAGLAIFGRIGEFIRPLLVARKTGLTFASQVAVVTVERVFDLGAFGLIFALNLLLTPALQQLPYLHKAGSTIGALTVAIIVFVVAVRVAGEAVAHLASAVLSPASPKAGAVTAEKILEFREGLSVIDGTADFLLAAGLSLLLWAAIAAAYVLALRAFPAPVHSLSIGSTVVLMGFSIAGSALPLPGGGGAWAGNVFALTNLLGIPGELAAGAGLMVWIVTNLSIIPAGLIYAQVEGISIAQVARRSEVAG